MKNTLCMVALFSVGVSMTACSDEFVEFLDDVYHAHHDIDEDTGYEECEDCYFDEDGTPVCVTVPCNGCYYDGAYHNPGERFPAADGCNTCNCDEDGFVACTEMACIDGCDYEGTFYFVGEAFDDGCFSCVCEAPGEMNCRQVSEDCTQNTGCDDGSQLVCKMMPPRCGSLEILAVRNGCYECVNRITCEPWGEPGCKADEDCEDGAVCYECATSSCSVCDDCVPACVILLD